MAATRGLAKSLEKLIKHSLEGNTWKKLANVTIVPGKTAIPIKPGDQERLGARLDFAGEVETKDGIYNKFELQPNAGKSPSSIREWARRHGGTNAVMATAMVTKEGTKEDVEKVLRDAVDSVKS